MPERTRLEGGPFDGVEVDISGRWATVNVDLPADPDKVARYTPTRERGVHRFRGYSRVVARLPLPGARFCDCGCRTSLEGKRADARWATDACRKRGPASPSPEGARNQGRTSGLQISYRKTAAGVADALLLTAPTLPVNRAEALRKAEEILRPLLPERQRKRLEARGS